MSLFDSSSKGLKFDTIGVQHTGTVKAAPRERQQTKFGSQEPDFWPNGDPKMQILVDLQTNLRESADDDGERTLYVASKNMRRAIGEAIRAAGASDIAPGGVLTVSYIGNDPASANPANPAKLYAAQYSAPASAFAGAAAGAQPVQQAVTAPQVPQVPSVPQAPVQAVQQPVQAPFVPQQAAPAAPHPSGLTADQIAQLVQLRAASIPEATIATAIGSTPQQIAVFDNTPF
jgi:hypothetical protein